MRWEGRRESDNIEDRRGSGDGGGADLGGGGFGGGGFGMPINLGGGGIGTILIMLVVSWLLGINPLSMLGGTSVGPGPSRFERDTRTAPPSPARNDQLTHFVATVLADNEDRWKTVLPEQAGDLNPRAAGMKYQPPKMVLFNGATRSACGAANAATGPFYCPNDQKVYIDLAFYDMLKNRFKAPGDFAQAYVIAHEIGHHIQNMLGILPEVHRRQASMSERDANKLSVRVELQADCLAGVWANKAASERDFIEAGDIEEALTAASRIGDDSIQKQMQGYVVPDSFTHGSSDQRIRWFTTGFKSGRMSSCDTFSATSL